MRNVCPVCDSPNRVADWTMPYLVPDGWELPLTNLICLCTNCGFIYYDNYKTQEDYDSYYSKYYDSDTTLTNKITHKRLKDLVAFIMQAEPNKDARIVDFGGGEGYVGKLLGKKGYKSIFTVNVGDELPENIDLIVASHVLEHVYDLKGTLDRLTKNLKGGFIVDVPDAKKLAKITTLPILDYHQKHINHFTTHTMNLLFERYGYYPTLMRSYTVDTHNYPSFGIFYEKIDASNIYSESMDRVYKSTNEKLEKLKQITEPVIVWGCGDICMHLLSKVALDIKYYVDIDPAFVGHPINGISVLNHVESDEPIVVIAQMQKSGILDNIEKLGLKNRVIVI